MKVSDGFVSREATEEERFEMERHMAPVFARLAELYGHVRETCDFCKAMDDDTAYRDSDGESRCVEGPDCARCAVDRVHGPVERGGSDRILFVVNDSIVESDQDGVEYPVGYGPLMGVALGRSVYLYPTTHHPLWAKYRNTHLIYHDRAAAEAFLLEAARS